MNPASSRSSKGRARRGAALVDQVVAYILANSGTEAAGVIAYIGASEHDTRQALRMAAASKRVLCCRRNCLPAFWMSPSDAKVFKAQQQAEHDRRQAESNKAAKAARRARIAGEQDQSHAAWAESPPMRVIVRQWETPTAPPAANSVFALGRMAA